MRMQKGLCIELNGESSVFLGQNGKFIHGTPIGETAVGKECFFYPAQAASKLKSRSRKPIWAPVIAVIAVAILFLSVLIPKQEAFAYVQVQVNPGIELGINESYEVISIRELNADGGELIEELGNWKNQSLEEVLDEVIALSMKETTDEIVITTVADEEDELADEEVVDSVLAISTKVMANNITVRLKEASKKQWRTSVEKSVPVGQMITDSRNPAAPEKLEKPLKEQNGQPLKLKEKVLPTVDKKEEKLKLEEKHEVNVEIETPPEEAVSSVKETPPGQEKRKETPAVKNGNPSPPGQEKRNEVPGQSKKSETPEADRIPAEKEGETAPGQQKKIDISPEYKSTVDSSEEQGEALETNQNPQVPNKKESKDKNNGKMEESTKNKQTGSDNVNKKEE